MSVTSGTKSESGFGETVRVVIHALLIALVIRTFLFQPFNIPSGSMKATLLVGDYLFVSKYSYGYSHYSIPLSPPLFSGRIFGSEPSRGDIVVFRLPKDDSTDYIKRVIGLPGDRIQMKEGLLYINDVPVKRERLSDFVGEDPCGSDANARVIVSRCRPVSRWIARFERFSTKYSRLTSAHCSTPITAPSSPDNQARLQDQPDNVRLSAERSRFQPTQVVQYSGGTHSRVEGSLLPATRSAPRPFAGALVRSPILSASAR